jgi:DNA-binding NarL/FixJ family response regulator
MNNEQNLAPQTRGPVRRKIRTVVADALPEFLQPFCQFIEGQTNLEIVGRCGNGLEAVRLVEELRPDLVLLDQKIPGISGLKVAAQLREQYPSLYIVIMSSYEEECLEHLPGAARVDLFVSKSQLIQDLRGQIGRLFPGAKFEPS